MIEGYVLQELAVIPYEDNMRTYAAYHYNVDGLIVNVDFQGITRVAYPVCDDMLRYFESRYPEYVLHTRLKYTELSGCWSWYVFKYAVLGEKEYDDSINRQ